MNKINFDKIYATEFVNFKDCYKSCDSYCCNNFLSKNFKILNSKQVILPLLESEYLYYKSKGGIQNIKDEKSETYVLKNSKKLKLYFLYCECGGLCEPHSLRPLICRIYPYFPLINQKGEILGFYPASLMDLFYSKEEAHCCTLVKENNIELKRQLTQNLKPLLEIPLFIFAFRALEILTKTLQHYLQNKHIDTLEESEKKKFFQKLEWSLLSNKAWNNGQFKDSILKEYEAIAKNFGDFL